MDCSWLMEDDGDEDPGSESDPEESQAELESRLYAIVHHSDLSQPLPPQLARHYTVQCGDDGKLTVALNDSLENIKSEEVKSVDQITKDLECGHAVPESLEIESSPEKDDVIFVTDNTSNSNKSTSKRFRYSDVNLDSCDVQLTVNKMDELSPCNINYSDLNYFKITPSFLNKKKVKKLKDLVIPASFRIDQSADWRHAANESFIAVGTDTLKSDSDIIKQMVSALKEANPKESKGKLYFLARALFSHNRKKHRKTKRRRQNKAKTINKELNSSLEANDEFLNIESKESVTNRSGDLKNGMVNVFNGCVSLNISPFKPLLPVVDLLSGDEADSLNKTEQKTSMKWKSLPNWEVPSKWSKKMTKFYTKPSDRKMKMELNEIFENLKRSSTNEDWRVDPRDEVGVYQRTPLKGKHKNRRCPNCHQHGHLMYDCPSPRKVPSCFLCGLNYHTAYSCPNKICLKCGVYVTNEAYECSSCYYNTFNYDTPCEVCGQVTHRSEICPDLWRSYHATVEGDKKIPEHVVENKRKYCCNCATKGHFSHQCPFPSCEGEHISSFVTNYSASPCANGTTEIVIPSQFSHIVDNADADRFFQKLSDSAKAVIDFEEGQSNLVFRISGTFEQCRKVRHEIEEYVNTKKRKRQEPNPKKKRRKIR